MRLRALVVELVLLVIHVRLHQIHQYYVQMGHTVEEQGVNVKYVQEGIGEAVNLQMR